MTPRPRGEKDRNLTLYRGSIHYQRTVKGKRRFKCLKSRGAKVTDWDLAVRLRDALEERLNGKPEDLTPLLADACKRYLEQGTRHLAPSTARSRKKLLGKEGRLLPALGNRRLGEIDGPMLHRWYAEQIAARELAHRTGLHYLNALNRIWPKSRRRGTATGGIMLARIEANGTTTSRFSAAK